MRRCHALIKLPLHPDTAGINPAARWNEDLFQIGNVTADGMGAGSDDGGAGEDRGERFAQVAAGGGVSFFADARIRVVDPSAVRHFAVRRQYGDFGGDGDSRMSDELVPQVEQHGEGQTKIMSVPAGCFVEAALEVAGGDGLDGVVDGEFEDGLGGEEGGGEK